MGRIKRILDVKAVNQLAYQFEGSDHSVIFRNLHGNNSAALLDQYADNLDNTGDKIANRVSVWRHSNKYGVFQIDLEAHFDGSAKDNLPEFNAWLKRELLKAALTVERTHGYRSGNPSEPSASVSADTDDREANPANERAIEQLERAFRQCSDLDDPFDTVLVEVRHDKAPTRHHMTVSDGDIDPALYMTVRVGSREALYRFAAKTPHDSVLLTFVGFNECHRAVQRGDEAVRELALDTLHLLASHLPNDGPLATWSGIATYPKSHGRTGNPSGGHSTGMMVGVGIGAFIVGSMVTSAAYNSVVVGPLFRRIQDLEKKPPLP